MPSVDNPLSSLIINELTSEQYNALVNAGQINNSQLYMVNDVAYPTFNDFANVAFSGNYNDLSNTPTIPDALSELDNDTGFINSSALSDYALTNSLADVATTGEYDDLLNKPTFPTIDATYNGLSPNAQSGIAVAQAINNISGGSFEIMNSAEYANITPVAGTLYFITDNS